MGIVGIYGNDDSRRLMGSPSLLAMSREFDHDESAQRGKISAGGRQLPQPLGSTPPTQSRPRGSQLPIDSCSRGIFCGRWFIIPAYYPGGTTPSSLARELAPQRLRELPSAAAHHKQRALPSAKPTRLRVRAHCVEHYPSEAQSSKTQNILFSGLTFRTIWFVPTTSTSPTSDWNNPTAADFSSVPPSSAR